MLKLANSRREMLQKKSVFLLDFYRKPHIQPWCTVKQSERRFQPGGHGFT